MTVSDMLECSYACQACCLSRVHKDQFDNEEMHAETVHLGLIEIFNAFEDIHCSTSEVYLRGLPENMPWSTFEILIAFIGTSICEIGRCVADKLGVPELPDDMKNARLSHSQLNQIWASLLASLRDGLVPLEALHEAICKNLLCYGCKVPVTQIRRVFLRLPYKHFEALTVPYLVLGRSGSVYSVCGEVECSAKVTQLLPIREPGMMLLYKRLTDEFRGELCDYCGLLKSGG